MAYNPFNIFRRNQKALFAVLTVFIMVMFTLQSGVVGGDALENFARWLGGRAGSKEAVCKIDGSSVTAYDLEGVKGLQFRRTLANRFMYLAAVETVGRLNELANQQRAKLSPLGQQMAEAVSQAMPFIGLLGNPEVRNNPQFMQLLFQIDGAQRLVARVLDAPDARAEDREVARLYQTSFVLQEQLARSNGDHYFGNAPNRTRRELIEFKLWQKKADALGIRFGRDDVKRLIQAEFSGAFKSDVRVREAMARTTGFTMELTLESIGEEFRVRAAQAAVMGFPARYGRATAFATPYEAFEFYREQTSQATYQLIAVPAAGFDAKVPGAPTAAEIADLYTKYKDTEPDPRRETPGLKVPRKVKVAYLGITGEEPYYKKLAAEQLKVGEALAKASGALTVPVPGTGGAWGAALAGALGLKDPAVDAAYAAYTRAFESELKFKFGGGFGNTETTARDVLDVHWAKPGAAAAAVGGFVGQAAGFGHPGVAAAVAAGAPFNYEVRDRAKVGTPLVLGFATGPALLPGLVGAAAASKQNEPKPLPIGAKRADLLGTATDRRAKELAFGEQATFENQGRPLEKGDVERFREELKKQSENGQPKDRAATEKYIKEFVAARGLTITGASTELRDEWAIEDDPGLRALVDAQRESRVLAEALGAHGGAMPYRPFGRALFWATDSGARRTAATGTFLAEPLDLGTRDRVRYLFWRTEDAPAVALSREDATPAIVAAWKRAKARELAKARAEQIAETVRTKGPADPVTLDQFLYDQLFALKSEFIDPKALQRAKKFAVTGVAPLVVNPGFGGFGGGGGLSRYRLPESENLPFVTDEFEKALLDTRDKPAKTVLVLPDPAKDVYYVATLVKRDLKLPDEFRFDVFGQFGRARDVLGLHHNDASLKARQSIVELLKQEFRYEETEEQKKKLDDNAKSGGREL